MFRSKHPSVITLVMSVVLQACMGASTVHSQSQPDWVTGEAGQYPQVSYMTATGSASDAEKAQDRARANLAKIFETRISQDSIATTDTQSHRNQAGESVSSQQRLKERVNITTDKMLEGIRIAEQWHNSADQTYHALAVLSRSKVGGILSERMNELDQSTQAELDLLKSTSDSIKKIAIIQRAIALQETRKDIKDKLQIIDNKGKTNDSIWTVSELRQRSDQALGEINLSVSTHPNGFKGLQQLVQSALSKAGFTVSDGGGEFTIKADVLLDEPEDVQNWYWQRGTLNISLVDNSNSVIRGNKTWALKVSATNKSQLIGRIRRAIEKSLKKELRPAILEMAKVQ